MKTYSPACVSEEQLAQSNMERGTCLKSLYMDKTKQLQATYIK